MTAYIIRRLLWFIPVLIVTLTILFIIMQVVPGDPIQAAFGSDSPLTKERIIELRAQFGLDQPLYIRFARWWWIYYAAILEFLSIRVLLSVSN